MIKILMALIFSAMAFQVHANTCSYNLKDRRGGLLLPFTRYSSWSQSDACEMAREACQTELFYRNSRGLSQGAFCEKAYQRFPREVRCEYDLISRRGRFLDSFLTRGYDQISACNLAKDRCYEELIRRNRRGRDLGARCLPSRQRRDDRRGTLTASCSVNRIATRGNIVQTHFATMRGREFREVKRRACDQAMRQCQNMRVRRQSCRLRR